MNPARAPTLLEKNLLGVAVEGIPRLLPGLLLAALLAWASTQLCQWVGCTLLGFARTPISAVTTAILLGLLVNNLFPLPALFRPGITFAVKKVLRLGIILLGIRLSLLDVLQLGATGVPVVLCCIAGALLCTRLLARWLHLPHRLGTLIAVGTSICGVSAVVATGPAIDAEDEEVAYAVATITLFGIVATFAYPFLARALFRDDPFAAGLFLGTAIHDTSQVTGAALIFAGTFDLPRAVDVATVTKLVRNVFMALVIPLMAMTARRDAGAAPGDRPSVLQLLPRFVLGFLLVALLRTLGDAGVNAGGRALALWTPDAWAAAIAAIKGWAVDLLVVALAGVGLSTSARVLQGLGLKPLLVGFAAALLVGLIGYAAISILSLWIAL